MNLGSEGVLAERLGYRFNDAGLLRAALTHRSHGSPHNERLEFVGDSVLNMVIALELYQRFPAADEGELSRLRATLVNRRTLSDVAETMDLGAHIWLGEGELKSGGFRRPSILADALEALFGAVMIDAGFEAARQVIARVFAQRLAQANPAVTEKDPKTKLQEFLQSKRWPLPQYRIVAVSGEAHEQTFRVVCEIAEHHIVTEGEGASRRAAEMMAAQLAYAQCTETSAQRR